MRTRALSAWSCRLPAGTGLPTVSPWTLSAAVRASGFHAFKRVAVLIAHRLPLIAIDSRLCRALGVAWVFLTRIFLARPVVSWTI